MPLDLAPGREAPAGVAVKEPQKRTAAMEKRLDIRLIGAFSVTDPEGKSHALPGRKDRAVLAFVAAHRGRAIARERLVELIWPGAAEGAGRASLRQSISTIRKSLPQPAVLSVDRDTVSLNPDCADTDVGRLEQFAPADGPVGRLALVNGETFLDDLGGISVDFDTWRATEQSRLESLVSDLVDELARRAEASRDTRTAVAALSQLVALNPLNEAAQRRYMQALISLGQANSAIRQYQKLETLLRDELGLRPEPATQAILSEAKERRRGTTGEMPENAMEHEPAKVGGDGKLPTVTVYGFRDLSNDGGDQSFAEGLSDSITAALLQISGLVVVTRRSAPASDVDPPGNADEQEAFALHGSVRRIENRVRVGARLVGQVSGRVYWAEDYDRDLEDIFAVQDDITLQVTVEMRIKLSEGEKIRVLARYTKKFEVWTRLMRADVLVNTLIEEDNIEARRLLLEAVEIDPTCAAALGELADTYIGDYMMGRRSLPKDEILEQARRAAEKAIEVEPDFIHALNIISLAQAFRGEFDRAKDTARGALSAAPRNPEIAANSAYALALCGCVDEAQDLIRRAIENTPIPPMWYLTVEGLCHYMKGQHVAAIERLREAVRLVPDSAFARPYLIGALMESGATGEATKIAAEIHRVQPDFSLSNWPGADFADAVLSKNLTRSLARAGVRQ